MLFRSGCDGKEGALHQTREGNLRKCTTKWLEGRWKKIHVEFECAQTLMGCAREYMEGGVGRDSKKGL